MLKIKSRKHARKSLSKWQICPKKLLKNTKDQVPAELLQIWQEDGLGTFRWLSQSHYPDDYLELLQDSYSFRGSIAFPMFMLHLEILLLGKRMNLLVV